MSEEYWIVLTSPVAPWDEIVGRIGEHARYQEQLLSSGRLVASGPFVENEGAPLGEGLTILLVEGEDEARELAEGDPLVRDGLRRVVVHRWQINQRAPVPTPQ